MFGIVKPVKMPRQKPRECPVLTDYHMSCLQPYCWAHPGSTPNSNQKIRMIEYHRKKEGDYIEFLESQKGQYLQDKISAKFDKHSVKKRFQGQIKKRVINRMKEYEESIEKRREKLKLIFANEERVYYKETVDVLQRGGETRLQEMRETAQKLRDKREEERLALLAEKRVLQYRNRCVDLRTAMEQKNCVECKNSQLQQIRENQARREAEKEIDRLWYDVNVKERQAKTERIEYDAIVKKNQGRDLADTWELQIRGKEALRAEMQRIKEEEKVEIDKLKAQLEKEEYEALLAKERRRELKAIEIEEQMAMKQKSLAERKKGEDALTQAFTILGQLELEKSQSKSYKIIAKQEMAQYRIALAEIEEERKEEDARLNELLDKFMKEAQKRKDDARCKVELAKRKLLWDTLKGREEQVKEKKILAQKQLEMKQAENEFTRMCFETNERLAAEMWRQGVIAKRNYQHDLLKQIEYKRHLQQKEKENLERQLEVGRKEEEYYVKMVQELCYGSSAGLKMHPFRCLIESSDCSCPVNQNQQES